MIDAVEFVEEYFGIKLLEYQKILIRNYAENKHIYITYPWRCGKTYFMELINKWNELNESKN